MMTTPPSTLLTPDASSEVSPILWRAAHQDLLLEGPLENSEISLGLATPLVSAAHIFDQTVEISPIDAVKRHSTGRYGIVVESIYAPIGSRIQIHYNGLVHLLVLHEDGARREGETSIDDLTPSSLRKLTNKMTFVPAGHTYQERHETSAPIRVTYLYLSPARLQKSTHVNGAYVPKVLFEDSILWATSMKLKTALESNNSRTAYLEALVNVLAHELSWSGQEASRALPANRGGLATWQMRAVIAYIEEHLTEQISLVTLARLARLSQHHFCRAFKQSLGIPPHTYHLRRRMQHAKALLSDRTTSITEIGLLLGYSNSSSFTLAFRKITGQTPSGFRRNFK
jgi:AraC family transcriptional regulator